MTRSTPQESLCKDARRSVGLSRRGVLQAGLLGATGLGLADVLRAEAAAREAGRQPAKKNVIILWMRGGPSHIDTWDMKPNAPSEYRGEFHPVSTAVPGIQICHLLPRSAAIMDKWSIVRSLYHRKEDGDAGHSSGDQICFTGYPSGPNADQNVMPSCGSVVARQVQNLNPELPAYVMIPRMVPGTGPGHFGAKWQPFETQADPANRGKFSIPNLSPAGGMSFDRLGSRFELLREIDSMRRDLDASGQIEALDQFQRQAWDVLSGTAAREAFDLDAEPEALRERYGWYEPYRSRVRAGGDAPNWPQRLILARRLVEAGVRLVTVDCRWWDTHEDNFWALENGFLPRWDQAYTALIEDLESRGLLEDTLVLAWGEFGRTPRVNASAGRDHYPNAFAAAFAGGGVQGGRVVGATDAKATMPSENPKIPQDVLATVYRHLGVDTRMAYNDHAGRPHPVLPAGNPIDELFV